MRRITLLHIDKLRTYTYVLHELTSVLFIELVPYVISVRVVKTVAVACTFSFVKAGT